MKYEVWQTKELHSFLDPKPNFPKDYDKVAIVECVDEEDAFRATNHIESDWTKNPEVVELFKSQCRSTSCGDVLVDEDGNGLYCAPCGWDDMGKVENLEINA